MEKSSVGSDLTWPRVIETIQNSLLPSLYICVSHESLQIILFVLFQGFLNVSKEIIVDG